MKKHFLILLLIFSIRFVKAQHYTQGLAYDTTLHSGHFMLTGNCMQTFQFKMQLDTSLFNYVTGMKFIVVFDTVTGMMAGGGSFGNIQTGDTIELNAAHPAFAPLGSYSCWYRLKLVGTPQTAGQTYPCEIELMQCTCTCTDMTIRKSMLNTSNCSVSISNGISNIDRENVAIYPNPSVDKLSINGITEPTLVLIYDSFGKMILEKRINTDTVIETAVLPNGVYTVHIIGENRKNLYTKVVIAR